MLKDNYDVSYLLYIIIGCYNNNNNAKDSNYSHTTKYYCVAGGEALLLFFISFNLFIIVVSVKKHCASAHYATLWVHLIGLGSNLSGQIYH